MQVVIRVLSQLMLELHDKIGKKLHKTKGKM